MFSKISYVSLLTTNSLLMKITIHIFTCIVFMDKDDHFSLACGLNWGLRHLLLPVWLHLWSGLVYLNTHNVVCIQFNKLFKYAIWYTTIILNGQPQVPGFPHIGQEKIRKKYILYESGKCRPHYRTTFSVLARDTNDTNSPLNHPSVQQL